MHGLFPVVAVGVYRLAAVLKIFVAVTFLVTEHRLLGSWAQELWDTGIVAPRHVDSSPHDPCVGRQILNHWTTRETRREGTAVTLTLELSQASLP